MAFKLFPHGKFEGTVKVPTINMGLKIFYTTINRGLKLTLPSVAKEMKNGILKIKQLLTLKNQKSKHKSLFIGGGVIHLLVLQPLHLGRVR